MQASGKGDTMRYRLARMVVLISYFSIFFLTLFWAIQFASATQFPTTLRIIIFTGPLLLTLRGLLHAKPKSYAWTGFLALGYFTAGIVEAYSQTDTFVLALLLTCLSLSLFTSAIVAIRYPPTPT